MMGWTYPGYGKDGGWEITSTENEEIRDRIQE